MGSGVGTVETIVSAGGGARVVGRVRLAGGVSFGSASSSRLGAM